MSNNRFLEPETYYHIYNRGFNKQTLFYDEDDYQRFFNNLERYKQDEKYKSIKILSYCLLPNHFHFLIIETVENIKEQSNKNLRPVSTKVEDLETGLDFCLISEFMRKISVAYAMYFNAKYGESIKKGLKFPVFEGRFKAKEITSDTYLAQVSQYIEWNAVKHEIVEKPEDWAYSSYKSDIDKNWIEYEEDFDPLFE